MAETSPPYANYLSTYGYVYADLKRFKQALASYQTYLDWAMVYRLMGDYQAALTCLDQERQLIDQHYAEDDLVAQSCAYRGLVQILNQASHLETARKLFEQAGDDKGSELIETLLASMNSI